MPKTETLNPPTSDGATPSWPAWTEPLRGALKRHVPLAPMTTLRIGGPADWYYPAESVEALVAALAVGRAAGIPITLLGDGSNVLISDRGVRGLVIHNRARLIERRENELYAEAGASLADLVSRSRDESLTGLEFASGIFGSVGGAVYGNAGAYGRSIADVLVWAEVLTPEGERLRLAKGELEFAYRRSGCAAHGWIVLSSLVRLSPGDREAIGAEMDRIIGVRATKLPVDIPSAGSYFKNIEDPSAEFGKVPAGRLLEDAGAKSLRVGDAGVYEKHANVIVNLGQATAADVLALAGRMKDIVRQRCGIELENEVRFLGEPMG